jgi:undecaprenyl-diphosphatase
MNRKHKQFFKLASLAGFIGFVFFTWLVKKDLFVQKDFDMTVRIQNHTPVRFDAILDIATFIGHIGVVSIALAAALYLFHRKKSSLIVFGLFIVGHVPELFLKTFLRQPGPPFQFHRYNNTIFLNKDYVVPGSSYPSGHSFRALFFSIVFIYLLYKKKGPTLSTLLISCAILGMAALIMFAKVVLGEHWATDIVGGILLAANLGFASLLLL